MVAAEVAGAIISSVTSIFLFTGPFLYTNCKNKTKVNILVKNTNKEIVDQITNKVFKYILVDIFEYLESVLIDNKKMPSFFEYSYSKIGNPSTNNLIKDISDYINVYLKKIKFKKKLKYLNYKNLLLSYEYFINNLYNRLFKSLLINDDKVQTGSTTIS